MIFVFVMLIHVCVVLLRSVLTVACEQTEVLLFDPISSRHIKTLTEAHEDCVNNIRCTLLIFRMICDPYVRLLPQRSELHSNYHPLLHPAGFWTIVCLPPALTTPQLHYGISEN